MLHCTSEGQEGIRNQRYPRACMKAHTQTLLKGTKGNRKPIHQEDTQKIVKDNRPPYEKAKSSNRNCEPT